MSGLLRPNTVKRPHNSARSNDPQTRVPPKMRDAPEDLVPAPHEVTSQMPELSGLQLLEIITQRPGPKPAVILVTAFPEHAVEAFEKRALDYVLKFIVPSRVHAALDVAVRRSAEERAARLLDLLDASTQIGPRSRRIAIRDKSRTVFTDVAELIAAEADGNYVMLHKTSGRRCFSVQR